MDVRYGEAGRAVVVGFSLGLAFCRPAAARPAAARPAAARPAKAARPTVPPASFLHYHVSDVPGLSRELASDPAVRGRLACHFHLTGAELQAYVRDDLVVKRLCQAKRYKVYCVTPLGREYFVRARLPAGTPVFASRADGTPILKLACGNPLTALLPPRSAHGVTPVAEDGVGSDVALLDEAEMPAPGLDVTAGLTAPDAPAMMGVDAAEAGAVAVTDACPSLLTALGGGGLAWQGPASVFGGLVALRGLTETRASRTPLTSPALPFAAPEPGTPWTFGAGAAALLALAWRRSARVRR